MLPVILNKSYAFSAASIIFRENGVLGTPWAIGKYTIQDPFTIEATWDSLAHTFTFNTTYTEFTSVRKKDGQRLKGTLLHTKSKIPHLYIDYKNVSSELCILGRKYNVDKSSQRDNPGPNDANHCHPYTLVYNKLFSTHKYSPITFCEIGIADGRSLLMWNEYFTTAKLYGFERWPHWLTNWKTKYYDLPRVSVNYMNVRKADEITTPFTEAGVTYDCIIDDSTHCYYDMIRIIKCALPFVNPGGMIIIEDIQKSFDEYWFYTDLFPLLHEFSSLYFIDLEHDRRNSGTINNDKLLILIKKGTPIFSSFL
jgi:hypothetical protein